MTTPSIFRQYIWLVNTISEARKISLAEINQKWLKTEMSGGVELARSTFNRHKDAIEDIFDIIIDCDKRDGYRYYIANEEVLDNNSVQNWMISTMSVSNVLSENLSLRNRILLENVPSGGNNLQLIIKAMKESSWLSVDYKSYHSAQAKTFTLAPYCVKLYRQRWYVLGKLQNGEMRIFSLDRFRRLEAITDKFVIDADFDAYEYFSASYGIVANGPKPERIVIRAYNEEKYRMRDLPLHHSQKIINETADYVDFEIFMSPTLDFSGYILSRNCQAKILEPQWLANEIHDMHLDAVMMYEGE